MPASDQPDIMDDPTFDQMIAEAVHILGVEPLFNIFEPVCGTRSPFELDREQRTALMIRVGLLCREVRGGVGHG
jgi:hypothetical protein